MLAAYTELKNAQKVKQFLVKKKILNSDYKVIKELNHIYFPLKKKMNVPRAKVVNTKFSFPNIDRNTTIDEILKGKLTKKEMKLLPRSQEIVGKIMVLEIPKELVKKEKLIAQAYLDANKNVSTVVKKQQEHLGVFRTRKVKLLAGKKTKETIHHENGIKVKLHLEKTYFSARSANERLRISKQVKKNEQVLVMFSGAAPFPLVLAKNSPVKGISAVELNPLAHQYALENVSLNNFADKIEILHGDVRRVVPKLNKKFDRIVMPLPKTGEEFLSTALKKSKKGAIIHLYAFLHENDVKKHTNKVKQICNSLKKPVRILRKVKCGQFSPGTFRMCFDLKVK